MDNGVDTVSGTGGGLSRRLYRGEKENCPPTSEIQAPLELPLLSQYRRFVGCQGRMAASLVGWYRMGGDGEDNDGSWRMEGMEAAG